MKTCFLFVFLFLLCARLPLAAQPELYGRTIYVSSGPNDVLSQSVADLRLFLEKATGKTFAIATTKPAQGIVLQLLKKGAAQSRLEQTLEKGGIEDYVISGSSQQLTITATHPLGLSRGIYGYLDALGIKWYLPGDEWTVIPRLQKIAFTGERYEKPSFVLRDFFGTGDIAPVPALDPANTLRQKWMDWKRRNRMGGEFALSGHYGEVFNLKYQAELQKHPEYLALVKGKREWSSSSKWCISNAGLRQLFISDRVEELKRQLQNNPYANQTVLISVDPSDGYGDCECEACAKLGSVSDRDFFLANEVAKAFSKISSRGYATIFAYSTHAAAPRFALHPQVLVTLIPYAFQSVGTPDQMIAQWQKQHSNFLVYDYYGLPDWHWDTPLTGGWGMPSYLIRVKGWKQLGMKGFLLESSFSSATTGLALYTAGRLGWNMNENATAIEDGFYKQLFGAASPFIRDYYAKLMRDFRGAADLPYLFQLLYQAGNATADEAIQARLSDLKAYLHYLVIYYRQLQNPSDIERKKELYDYAMQLYPTALVHSTRIAELLLYQQPEGSELRKSWDLQSKSGRVSQLKALTQKDIEHLFVQDRKAYPVLEGFEYVAKPSSLQFALAKPASLERPPGDGMLILDWPETYVRPSARGQVTVWLKVNETSENNMRQQYSIELLDVATGKTILSKKLDLNPEWQAVTLSAAPGKTYKLMSHHPNWIRMSVPEGQWLAFGNIPTYTVLGKLWLYNSKQNAYVYFHNTANEQPWFNNVAGNGATVEKVNELGLYRVRLTGGQWWTIGGTEYKFLRFFNQGLLFFPHNNIGVTNEN